MHSPKNIILICVGTALIAPGCSPTHQSNGSATVQGTLQGQPFPAQTALFFKTIIPESIHMTSPLNANDSNTTGTIATADTFVNQVMLATHPGVCEAASADQQQSTTAYLVLQLTATDVGTYSVALPQVTTSEKVGTQGARAQYYKLDSQCGSTSEAGATAGSVIVTASSANTLTGTFTVSFSDGDTLQGQFSAAACDALAKESLSCD